MRKVVAGLFVSLDGVVESPEKWNFPYFNDEMVKAVGASSPEGGLRRLRRFSTTQTVSNR